jgi:hypothetical protein
MDFTFILWLRFTAHCQEKSENEQNFTNNFCLTTWDRAFGSSVPINVQAAGRQTRERARKSSFIACHMRGELLDF